MNSGDLVMCENFLLQRSLNLRSSRMLSFFLRLPNFDAAPRNNELRVTAKRGLTTMQIDDVG